MYEEIELPESISKTFEIDSTNFRLRMGDRVGPQTDRDQHVVAPAERDVRLAGAGETPVGL